MPRWGASAVMVWAARLWLAIKVVAALAAWASLSSEIMLCRAWHPLLFGKWWWWSYLPKASDPTTGMWLTISAAIPPMIYGVRWLARRSRKAKPGPSLAPEIRDNSVPVMPAASDNHGHAAFEPDRKLRRRYNARHGVPVGILARPHEDPAAADLDFDSYDEATWGAGVKDGHLLIDHAARGKTRGSTHFIDFAGPDGLKSSALVTTLLHWPWGAFVLDVAGELSAMLTRDRQEWFGQRVYVLSPDSAGTCGINASSVIDVHRPGWQDDIHSLLNAVSGEPAPSDGKQDDNVRFFQEQGRNVQAAILAHVLWSDIPGENKTLATFWHLLKTPEKQMPMLLKGIQQSSRSKWARDLAGTVMEVASPNTWAGIYGEATRTARWPSEDAFASLVSTPTYDVREFWRGDTTIFLAIEPDALRNKPGLARVIIWSLMKEIYRRKGRIKGRCLFLLDEVRFLGPMSTLTEARDLGRKFGITLGLTYQSLGQMLKQWGQHAGSEWFNAVSRRSFATVADFEDAKKLSDQLGKRGVRAVSESENKGVSGQPMHTRSRSTGSGVSWHEVGRQLMFADEIIADLKPHERLVIPRTGRPFVATTPAWFFLPRISAGRVDLSTYNEPTEDDETEHTMATA